MNDSANDASPEAEPARTRPGKLTDTRGRTACSAVAKPLDAWTGVASVDMGGDAGRGARLGAGDDTEPGLSFPTPNRRSGYTGSEARRTLCDGLHGY
ncbi:MAG: hypothetical protein NVSMB51_05190 [Solirubrobacteraceae bacterium]